MSPGAIAGLLGALLIIGVVTNGLLWGLRRWLPEVAAVFIASALSLAIATVLGGFGWADGGPPKFEYAFSRYVLPQLIILALLLVRVWRGSAPALIAESGPVALTVHKERTWPGTLIACCVLVATGWAVVHYAYDYSTDGISYTVGQAIGTVLAGLVLVWFFRRWIGAHWTTAAILLASVMMVVTNLSKIAEGHDALEAKWLLAVTSNPSEIYLTAQQHPTNTILQVTAATLEKAEEAQKRAEALVVSLEPAGIEQEPNPVTASRADQEKYRTLLKEAEERSRRAGEQYAAILAQERASVSEAIQSRAPAARRNLLNQTLNGIDKRHAASRALGDQLFKAREDFYAAYGRVYDFSIGQYGRYRVQNGQFLFAEQATADRWNALVAAYHSAQKRLQDVASQLEDVEKRQAAQWKRAMSD